MQLRPNPAILLAVMFAFLSSTATAKYDNPYYLSLMYGATTGDDFARQSKDGFGPALGIGRHVSERWDVELGAWFNDFDEQSAGGPEWRESGLRFDGLRHFSRNPGFSPYFILGGGLVLSERTSGASAKVDASNAMANIGLGFTRRLHKSGFSLRAESRYRFMIFDASTAAPAARIEEVQLFAGLQLPLGKVPMQSRVAAAPSRPMAPPPDTDRDSVPDAADRCPGTPLGTRVDPRGCPTVVPLVLEDVVFALNSATVTPGSAKVLNRITPDLAKLLNENPGIRVEVGGHTDSSDDAASNVRMSLRRAAAVREYLVKRGIPTSRLVARGYGETLPLYDNSTRKGRALNRRVELKILK